MPDLSTLDYQGVALPISSAPQNWIGAGQISAYTVGTPLADAIYGDSSTMTMAGGAGDDTYYIYGQESVVEQPGQGVDQIIAAWTNVTLPANVENLTISGNFYGIGNSLNNIIIGDGGSQLLDGGAGDDVLTGGGGSDIFVFDANSGHDVISDFDPAGAAVVRLAGYPSLTNFSDVQAGMRQQGADVVLTLDATDSITFRNTTIDAFTASDFQLPVDTSAMRETFADDFNGLSLESGGGVWRTDYATGPESDALGSRTLTSNNEQEIYVDPLMKGKGSAALGLNPFSISNGILTITASPTPAGDLNALYGYHFTSGLLTTRDTFSQEYGYYEVRAQLPAGAGAWPAFWLLPSKGGWPPELDVMEGYGGATVTQTAHTTSANTEEMTTDPLTSGGYHTYGMLWDAQHITWYMDGVETAQIATPADMHQPMYMLLDLAVDSAVASPAFTAQLNIDYVHAYSLTPDQATTGDSAATPGVMIYGSTSGDQLFGAAGADTIIGLDGPDTISGGGGNDQLYGNTGNDLIYGGSGFDTLYGGKDQDTLVAGSGPALLFGNLGDDVLVGGAGNDTLYGGQGNDRLTGGPGDDVLSGDRGDDTLTGGAGHDTFYFGPNGGHDVITDFTKGDDKIDISAFIAAGLHASAVDEPQGALVTVSTGETILVLGVHVADLGLPAGWVI